jgi:flagellar protein FlbD
MTTPAADGSAVLTLKDDLAMILLTRLNGPQFALNPDLIERAEATPDTVLTLCDGHKVLVAESVQELIDLVREYRASVLSLAERLTVSPATAPVLTVVRPPAGGQ